MERSDCPSYSSATTAGSCTKPERLHWWQSSPFERGHGDLEGLGQILCWRGRVGHLDGLLTATPMQPGIGFESCRGPAWQIARLSYHGWVRAMSRRSHIEAGAWYGSFFHQ
ncbi:hypothetical protein BJX66DRAFT_290956 [Aspergillus keveii]|uniref:Uncharacterized protein n=1 Tax=Aspergillus keveii TaxID=714993 RepID=A0ABR4GN37_9EURO